MTPCLNLAHDLGFTLSVKCRIHAKKNRSTFELFFSFVLSLKSPVAMAPSRCLSEHLFQHLFCHVPVIRKQEQLPSNVELYTLCGT